MKAIDSATLREILSTCMPSEDMARFLADNPPSPHDLVELVHDAPIPLRTKVKVFEALVPFDPRRPGDAHSTAHQLAEHRRALEEAITISDDEFLCLLDCCELTPDDEWDEDFSGVFASIDDALAWIAAYYDQPDDLTPEERAEYLNIIIEESQRLAGLSERVLALSKIEHVEILPEVERVDVAEQLRRAVVMLEPKWSRRGAACAWT